MVTLSGNKEFQKGDMVKAFCRKPNGKEAVGSPVEITRIHRTYITAIDKDGAERELHHQNFWFEKIGGG
jgi:hypothetical protein